MKYDTTKAFQIKCRRRVVFWISGVQSKSLYLFYDEDISYYLIQEELDFQYQGSL